MALRVFHPCQFGFKERDVRVDSATLSGGVSLSGYEDVVGTSGGGTWRADFSSAVFGGRTDDRRAETLAWRSINAAMGGGAIPVVVQFCDRLHQPINDAHTVPGTVYVTNGAAAAVTAVVNGQAGGLRATILDIAIVSERPLIGGERFTHIHPTWGERAYEIVEVAGSRIVISPPIRGGIKVGDPLDFDNVRCRMRRTSSASNALSMGVFSSGSISFAEDMRPPL